MNVKLSWSSFFIVILIIILFSLTVYYFKSNNLIEGMIHQYHYIDFDYDDSDYDDSDYDDSDYDDSNLNNHEKIHTLLDKVNELSWDIKLLYKKLIGRPPSSITPEYPLIITGTPVSTYTPHRNNTIPIHPHTVFSSKSKWRMVGIGGRDCEATFTKEPSKPWTKELCKGFEKSCIHANLKGIGGNRLMNYLKKTCLNN